MTSTAAPLAAAPMAAASDSAEIGAIIRANLHREGPLLPILHDLQATFGHVPDAARAAVSDALNITQAELHGVISFYHDFRSTPAGKRVLKICRAEACQAMGANDLSERVLTMLGLNWNETTADGSLTVEPVYCLGLCACAPAAMVDGQVRGRVTADALVAEATQ